ncbi:MAG: tRNA pseudouridine(38-40) synthase TruA, partial [Vallitaleaceae bacterium]|nr:tRNA pseudouridine(38-40) synthase TruA [Vallitaleaceae bacterium]
HAKHKTYRYLIYNDDFMNPLYNHNAYYIHKPLDIDKMNLAVPHMIGEHDFLAFSTQGSSVSSTTRTIYNIDIEQRDHLVQITVTGDGFLYNMVRIIVGALIQVGLGFYEPEYIKTIISSKDRSLAKRVAPAKGLTLMDIQYEEK